MAEHSHVKLQWLDRHNNMHQQWTKTAVKITRHDILILARPILRVCILVDMPATHPHALQHQLQTKHRTSAL